MPRKLTLEDAIKSAEKRGGQCLSTQYTNNKDPLLWRCSNNHECKVKNGGHWCPYCNVGRNTLEDMQAYAQEKGGHCLSDCYYNVTTKLLWICKNLHTWETTPSSIKQGSWCPMCRFKRGNLCRKIVSKYLGPSSKNRQPDFLKNPKHPTGLQLDIPYYHYGFAIEVQGPQHEKYIEFFHNRDPKNFIKQQERDQLKEELCEENWIVLRYVWYYEDPFEKIPAILRELGLIP
ncbi:6231_t:CDS:2 [Paraglomus occultum]|uniref:6231_t:CDS:1 n=1 Tax=Paraglomus occultum TaxID=144539 RepID=A0A9N9DHX8_9GLOM|nr:6231_t:CDS:2 [Paraglomus occultum]